MTTDRILKLRGQRERLIRSPNTEHDANILSRYLRGDGQLAARVKEIEKKYDDDDDDDD